MKKNQPEIHSLLSRLFLIKILVLVTCFPSFSSIHRTDYFLNKKESLSSPLASLSLYLILTAKLSLFPLLLPLHQLVRKSIFLQRLPSGCESLNRYHIDFVFNFDADLITKKNIFMLAMRKAAVALVNVVLWKRFIVCCWQRFFVFFCLFCGD